MKIQISFYRSLSESGFDPDEIHKGLKPTSIQPQLKNDFVSRAKVGFNAVDDVGGDYQTISQTTASTACRK